MHLADIPGGPHRECLPADPPPVLPADNRRTLLRFETPSRMVALENAAIALVGRRVCCFPARSRWGWLTLWRRGGSVAARSGYAIPPPGRAFTLCAWCVPTTSGSHQSTHPPFSILMSGVVPPGLTGATTHARSLDAAGENVLRWG